MINIYKGIKKKIKVSYVYNCFDEQDCEQPTVQLLYIVRIFSQYCSSRRPDTEGVKLFH